MTDKEILKEIKRSIVKQWGKIQPDVLDVVYLDITEIAWLLEQAERAVAGEQEYVLKLKQRIAILEQRNKRISDSAIDLLAKNRLYQKVIEKSLHEVRYGYSDIAEEILLEALEGNNDA
ncbi:hypothetical protein [Caldifermentibacillus hisashii]|uniref:hypothetical protein n=1 Tax=Caldifermentibacillus hisashii TaxID=996558 RepID=UPI001C114811|nr:hypothetical protein [Caldifermentibacillus hisashii]MBU5342309.1 hypothetical protein [Caldifermentibacillus hisashii]